MAETRTYDPSEGDDLAKLVREALGDTIRPSEPGIAVTVVEDEEEVDDDGTPSLTDLPDLQF